MRKKWKTTEIKLANTIQGSKTNYFKNPACWMAPSVISEVLQINNLQDRSPEHYWNTSAGIMSLWTVLSIFRCSYPRKYPCKIYEYFH